MKLKNFGVRRKTGRDRQAIKRPPASSLLLQISTVRTSELYLSYARMLVANVAAKLSFSNPEVLHPVRVIPMELPFLLLHVLAVLPNH
jgi:hypothetical protein